MNKLWESIFDVLLSVNAETPKVKKRDEIKNSKHGNKYRKNSTSNNKGWE